jgi:hypothetical protein
MKSRKILALFCAILSIYHIFYICIMISDFDFDYPHLLGVNPIELLFFNFLIDIILIALIIINVKKIIWDKLFKAIFSVNILLVISFVIYCAVLYKYLIAFYNS